MLTYKTEIKQTLKAVLTLKLTEQFREGEDTGNVPFCFISVSLLILGKIM